MSFFLRHIGRYAAQKFASDPRAREKAAKLANAIVSEARQIAREEDRARAAGRALRRAMNKLQGNR
jgi:membrane-bound ClpP family serine protease